MKEENPFDYEPEQAVMKEFYLLRLCPWEWTKTDDLDSDHNIPFYDFSEDGRLFMAEAECPLCEGTVSVSAGCNKPNNYVVKDYACLVCGISGEVVGSHGGKGVTPRNSDDDNYIELPECIVIEVDV